MAGPGKVISWRGDLGDLGQAACFPRLAQLRAQGARVGEHADCPRCQLQLVELIQLRNRLQVRRKQASLKRLGQDLTQSRC